MAKPRARSVGARSGEPGATGQRRPVVREDDERISLHFDRRSIQSAMYRDDPFRLVLSYTRLMMAFLLFQPAPRELVIIGLGGGSLAKYCYRHLPQTRITSVEINARVIALRDTFAIPPDDERFRIVHANGADFIAERPDSCDVILLDGYDAGGLPRELSSQYFYDCCASALAHGGVLVANFLYSDERTEDYLDRISRAFDDDVMTLWSENRGNRVAYAIKTAGLPSRQTLFARASELDAQHGMAFRVVASKLLASIPPRGDRSADDGRLVLRSDRA